MANLNSEICGECGVDLFREFLLKPMDNERFVVVIDYGWKDAFVIYLNLTDITKVKQILDKHKAAVMFLLPPHSYGILEVFTEARDQGNDPYHTFNFKVNCCKRRSQTLEAKGQQEEQEPIMVECPPGSGIYHMPPLCPPGERSACVLQQDGTHQIKCVAGGPGGG